MQREEQKWKQFQTIIKKTVLIWELNGMKKITNWKHQFIMSALYLDSRFDGWCM